jgi:hypothetical protein
MFLLEAIHGYYLVLPGIVSKDISLHWMFVAAEIAPEC